MKALLYKDFCLLKKMYLFFGVVIGIIAFAVGVYSGNSSIFFIQLLPTLSSVLSLIALDDRNRWFQYSDSMPIGRKTTVTEKYVMMIILFLGVAVIDFLSLLIHGIIFGDYSGLSTVWGALLLFWIFCGLFSWSMAFMFKLGPEKGRIAFMIFGAVCGAMTAIFTDFTKEIEPGNAAANANSSKALIAVLAAAAISTGLLVLSWFAAVRWYGKRELG